MDDLFKLLPTVIDVLINSDSGRVVMLIGAFIILAGLYQSFRLIEKKPEEISGWQRGLTLFTILFGAAFLAVGGAFVLFRHSRDILKSSQEVENSAQRSENLRINKQVSMVIRLVTYSEDSSNKQVDRLKYLGLQDQNFTFVADYDELKGITAADAVKMTGVPLGEGKKVSAIIFPAPDTLIPVNSRGLLQVISELEGKSDAPGRFDVKARLSAAAWDDLASRKKYTYEFDNYSKYFGQYCEAANEFRCAKQKFSTSQFIGNLSTDWNPLGFA